MGAQGDIGAQIATSPGASVSSFWRPQEGRLHPLLHEAGGAPVYSHLGNESKCECGTTQDSGHSLINGWSPMAYVFLSLCGPMSSASCIPSPESRVRLSSDCGQCRDWKSALGPDHVERTVLGGPNVGTPLPVCGDPKTTELCSLGCDITLPHGNFPTHTESPTYRDI